MTIVTKKIDISITIHNIIDTNNILNCIKETKTEGIIWVERKIYSIIYKTPSKDKRWTFYLQRVLLYFTGI